MRRHTGVEACIGAWEPRIEAVCSGSSSVFGSALRYSKIVTCHPGHRHAITHDNMHTCASDQEPASKCTHHLMFAKCVMTQPEFLDINGDLKSPEPVEVRIQ